MDEHRNLIYGINSVRGVLLSSPGRVHKLHLLEGRRQVRLEELLSLARESGVPVTFQPKDALDRLTGGAVHQGAAAAVTPYEYADFHKIVGGITGKGEKPLVVVLDHIQDPQNLGAVARSAEAMGAHCLIVPRHRSASPAGGADKAAAGALSRIPVCRVPNLARALAELKEMGLWVLGTAAEEGTPLWELDLTGPLAVVIGGEEKGVRPGVRSQCDMLASIPLRGETESLNASVAAGMVLYEITRQRLSHSSR